MRFIRKNGRIIPIQDQSSINKRVRAGLAVQSTGARLAIAGAGAHLIKEGLGAASSILGGSANMNRKAAKASGRLAPLYAEYGNWGAAKLARAMSVSHSASADRLGRAANGLGKVASVAGKLTKPLLVGGVGAIAVGIGMTAHRIGGKKKK